MTLIWRSTRGASRINAELANYRELTASGWRASGCTPLPTPHPASTLEILTGWKPTDFFYAGPTFIVAEQLCDILKSFDVNAEFLPLNANMKGKPYERIMRFRS